MIGHNANAWENERELLTDTLRNLAKHHEQSCVGATLDPESDTPQCAEYLAARRVLGGADPLGR